MCIGERVAEPSEYEPVGPVKLAPKMALARVAR